MFEFDEEVLKGANIKVIGIGGGGCNAIDRMINQIEGVDLIACNTDLQVLNASLANHKIQIGTKLTKGLGSGANPEVGHKAAEEEREKIAAQLEGADMVFVTAGMGGGTGTGASAVIAEIARKLNALTVGIVTTPFDCEGKVRMRKALEGIARMREHVDSIIVINNQKLLGVVAQNTSLAEAFQLADEILLHAVQGITDIINRKGIINRDFADVRTTLSDAGDALIGTGIGMGENRALSAVQQAIQHPLIADVKVNGAKGVIVNVVGGSDVTLSEYTEAIKLLESVAHPDVELLAGFRQDPNLQDEVRVTVIATRFDRKENVNDREGRKVEQLNYDQFMRAEAVRQDPRKIRETVASPGFQRHQLRNDGQQAGNAFDDQNLDIPTFLRRGMMQ